MNAAPTTPVRPDVPHPRPQERNPLGRVIRIGKFGELELFAHWSLAVILGLLALLLSTSALPTAEPGFPAFQYWLAGTLTSIAFLATLAAHELAHALLARHYRMPVRRITLWLLGGFTELEGEPPSARSEAAIAAIGPATSLLIGAATAAIAWTTHLVHGPVLLIATLSWLAATNLLLGVFNLLPGAPLDGGRLLSAVVWWRTGDRARGNRVAGTAGSMVGIGLTVLGILEFLAGYPTGLWLVLLGWFLSSSAGAQSRTADLEGLAALQQLRAADVMSPVSTVVPSWWTVAELMSRVTPSQASQSQLPLIDPDGTPVGVLSWGHIARVPARARAETRVRDAVGHQVRPWIVTADTPLSELTKTVLRHNEPAVVVAGDRIIGTLSASDLQRIAALRKLGWQPPAPVVHPR